MINTVNDKKCTRDLSDSVKQRYKINTVGKSPTQIQKELAHRGVNGFVVKVSYNKVTMLVERSKVKKNREMIRK
ncbi:hypothetical protein TP70_02275 [Staphylococcus microti]|uniref:Uncharacterized protein n=1 Tax=Staphylococcus microti TaxID=569857 RepID=A0A0D6XRM4_9STAP|nr:hypothetical protein [Staphylococcus microti]KIX91459.1 hypothetical protein TP70_02275 [Staphylococcus microti]PNZ82475.1 hypothetical protein CD132_04045 [Staphylococcus microti]PNZ83660.1 hypothetical protein CD132_01915 [Staphylococcus microti]SUM57035.1 Uncharacterised protein [Staphylococcus microti]